MTFEEALVHPALVQALHREHAGELEAFLAAHSLPAWMRSMLRGHAAELRGQVEEALAHYEAALRLREEEPGGPCQFDLGARRRAAPGAPDHWLALAVALLRAQAASVAELDRGEHVAVTALEQARRLGQPRLYRHAAAARAFLALRAHGAEASPERHRRCLQANAAVEQLCASALQELEAAEGWERVACAARDEAFFMRTLLMLIDGEAAGIVGRGVERAWQLFRRLRQLLDLTDGDLRSAGLAASLPADAVVVEFLAIPQDQLRVAVTHPAGSTLGVYALSVEAASRLQLEQGESLRELSERHVDGDLLAPLCQWAYRCGRSWSALLLDVPITWEGGTTATLQEALSQLEARQLFVLPHGPTHLAPWSLLAASSTPGGRSWLESWPITICASWRCPPLHPPAPSGCGPLRILYLPLENVDVAASPLVDPEVDLVEELGRAARVWIFGHGRFLPLQWGDPVLMTMRIGQQLVVGLRQLVEHALRARRAGQASPAAVVLSICEAAETSRRGCLIEMVTPARSFLSAGTSCVVAPKWSVSSLCEGAIRLWIARDGSVADHARQMLLAAYQLWEHVASEEDIGRELAGLKAQAGPEGNEWVPLCDLAAFEVHGHIPSRHTRSGGGGSL
jgi:hypothetical protein